MTYNEIVGLGAGTYFGVLGIILVFFNRQYMLWMQKCVLFMDKTIVRKKPDLHFDLAQTYLSAGDLEYVSDGLVTILSPVGEFNCQQELITMSSEGKIYYVHEGYSYLWANSGEEAIEILCTGPHPWFSQLPTGDSGI